MSYPLSQKLGVIILCIILLLPSGVSALSLPSTVSQSQQFELAYHKDQGAVVIVRVVNPADLPLTTVKPTNNSSLLALYRYDIFLPYVSYEVEDPQEFHSVLARQVAETIAAENFDQGKLTPAQLVTITGSIVSRSLSYDMTMVSGSPSYDRVHDDVVSNEPLDVVFLKEKKGVCRQYSALFSYIANYIINTNKSPALRGVVVDEVISYDYLHAYNVIYATTKDSKTHSVVTAAFIDPTIINATNPLVTGNALNSVHDALFSEFIKSGRYQWTGSDEDNVLRALAGFAEQGDISVIQAQDEIVHNWLMNNSKESLPPLPIQTASLVAADRIARLSQSKDAAAKKIVDRYVATMAQWHKIMAANTKLTAKVD